jgi:chromosome partitioning protein
MKIIAIANQKGGVGKTTTAVNLSAALAELGQRILLVDLDPAGAEIEIARMDDHLTRLAKALAPLRADNAFDFILLDCPPSLGILMTNALAAADELLTPIQCEFFALEGLVRIVGIVEQIKAAGVNDRLELRGIVMTMFDSRTNLSAQVVADVREHFSEQVYETVIPRAVRLSEAPSFGKSILEYDANGNGARAYRALAQEFVRRHRPQLAV